MNKELNIVKFVVHTDVSDINDSMELDSGTLICEMTVANKNIEYSIDIEVRGEVQVFYDDCTYRYPSDFPSELAKYFHTRDESLIADKDYYLEMNNWFEYFVDRDGVNCGYDTVDVENSTAHDLFDLCIDLLSYYVGEEGYKIKKISMNELLN